MTKNTKAFSILSTLLLLCVFLLGCGRSQSGPPGQQQVVDRVRSEAAKILKKYPSQIDISKPLAALGADDLDVVEIVIAVEEACKVRIPDNALGDKPDEVSKTLTVQELADIVSKQPKTR